MNVATNSGMGFQPMRPEQQARPRREGWKPSPRSGFVMLEAVLALGLFATVATAMAVALNQLGSASTSMRREALLLRTLESAMIEVAHRQPLVASLTQTPADAFGVSVETQIALTRLTSPRGETLEGVYQVRVTATLDDGSADPMQRSLEQWVFNPGGGTPR